MHSGAVVQQQDKWLPGSGSAGFGLREQLEPNCVSKRGERGWGGCAGAGWAIRTVPALHAVPRKPLLPFPDGHSCELRSFQVPAHPWRFLWRCCRCGCAASRDAPSGTAGTVSAKLPWLSRCPAPRAALSPRQGLRQHQLIPGACRDTPGEGISPPPGSCILGCYQMELLSEIRGIHHQIQRHGHL